MLAFFFAPLPTISLAHLRTRTMWLLIMLVLLPSATTATAQDIPSAWLPASPWHDLLSSNPATLGSALPCSIDAVCGADVWRDEISAVVNVVRGPNATCTGVLINNAREDQTPYVLTAHHCGTPMVGDVVGWTFEFNYESATCGDPNPMPDTQSLTGATVVAAKGGQDDYVLLRLNDAIPASFQAYFAGWSIETPAGNGTTIGHPKGDAKKIAYDDDDIMDAGDFWLAQFDHGTVEAASSGSPLFDANHHVVGLVRSAASIDLEACSGPDGDDNKAAILFPKLSEIWTVGTAGTRLADFLDPDDTGITMLGALAATGIDEEEPEPAEIWINEINANTPVNDEFIEIVGPAGASLSDFVLDVYTCSANSTTLASSHTLSAFTFSQDYADYGLFVIGGEGLLPILRHQAFAGSDVLPDGSGLIVLKDASDNEIFDYQYDTASNGQPVNCPDIRTTRSAPDAPGEGTMGFASETPTANTPGTNALTFSPRSPNFDGGQILPVEFSSFDAVLDGRTALLNWTTASETNNAGFEVQHRYLDHSGNPFAVLSWIEGHGTTEVEQAYSFEISYLQPGRHVFRLKQIDFDGAFEYSPEVEVVVEMADRFVMEEAYPNPFNPEATFRFAVSRSQQVEVTMYDMLGRRVALLWQGEAETGRMEMVRIDGSGLPSGLYLINVRGANFMETQHITLVK